MERFTQIIIGTGIQSDFLVVDARLTGEHKYRGRTAILAELPTNIHAGHSGQVPIQYYDVIVALTQVLITFKTIMADIKSIVLTG